MNKNQEQYNLSSKKAPIRIVLSKSITPRKNIQNEDTTPITNFLPVLQNREDQKFQNVKSVRNQMLPINNQPCKFFRTSSKNVNINDENHKLNLRKSSIRSKQIRISHNSISNLNKSTDILSRTNLPSSTDYESNVFSVSVPRNPQNNFRSIFNNEVKEKSQSPKTSFYSPQEQNTEIVNKFNKELYDLKKELNAEKEQKDQILKLKDNELMVIEKVETKRIYGKRKDIKDKLVKAEILTRKYLDLEISYNNSLNQTDLLKQEIDRLTKRCSFLENQSNVSGVPNSPFTNTYTEKVIETKIVENNKDKLEVEIFKNQSYLQSIAELKETQNKLINKLELKSEKNKKLKSDLLDKNTAIEELKLFNMQKQNSEIKENFKSSNTNFLIEEKEFIINDLKNQMNLLQEEIKALKNTNVNETNLRNETQKELEIEIEQFKNQMKNLEAENLNLKSQKINLGNSQNEKLMAEKAKIEHQLRDNENQLYLQTNNILIKEEEIGRLKYILEEYKNFNIEKKKSGDVFEKEISSLKQLLELNKGLVEEKNLIISSLEKNETNLQNIISELENEILDLKDNKQDEEELEKLKNDINNKNEEIKMLKNHNLYLEKNFEESQSQNQETYNEKKNKFSEKDVEIEYTYQRILNSEYDGEMDYSKEVKTEGYVNLEEDNFNSLDNNIIKIENCYDYEDEKNNYKEMCTNYQAKIKFLELELENLKMNQLNLEKTPDNKKDKILPNKIAYLKNLINELKIDIIKIIKNLPDNKLFTEAEQNNDYFRTLCLALKKINSKLLQIDFTKMESKKTMEKVSEINSDSEDEFYSPLNEIEENNLTTLNQQLSDKILNLYSLISKYEKDIFKKDQKIKRQSNLMENQNNSDTNKLLAQIEDLKKERDEIKEKEMKLRNQVLMKKQNMLNELNSFVSTKKQFESSFLSEITKAPK